MDEQRFCVIGGEAYGRKTHMSLAEPDGEGWWWPVCRHPSPRSVAVGPVGGFEEVRLLVSCQGCRKYERRMLPLVQEGVRPRVERGSELRLGGRRRWAGEGA